MINWNRLFPPLRQRRNINYQDGRRSEQQAPPPLEVSEEQVISNTCTHPKLMLPTSNSFGEQDLKDIERTNTKILITAKLPPIALVDTLGLYWLLWVS